MKSKYKVLITDNEEETLDTLKKLLEQEGFTVETTMSTVAAFEKVKEDKYHIVLINVDMPEMDGIKLLKEIKNYDALTQVIMMSRNSTMDKILSSLEYGANDYIMKPIDNKEHLLRVIDYSVQKLERWRKCILLGVFKKLYNILFNQPEDFRVDENKLQVLKTLHGDAASAFEKIKNKNKIDTFVRDFDELFSHIVHMYDGQPDNDEKERSTLQAKMFGLIKRASDYIKGKHIFRVFKPEDNDFTDRLRKFAEMTDKSSTLAFLIDLSNLDTLDEDEVRALIEVKDQMKARNIGLGIIIEKPDARRLINIFDSLNTVEDFYLFRSETDAIMEMLYSQSSMQRIAGKANTLQNGCFSACSCVS